MNSKNKRQRTPEETAHVARIKAMPCICCGAKPEPSPSEAHEIRQGMWWLSIPLDWCCHRGPHGIHGDKTMFTLVKKTELSCLNEVIRMLLTGKSEPQFLPRKKPRAERVAHVYNPSSKIVPRRA